MQAGDTVRSKRAAMRCLYPKASDKAEDVNDLCLVLQFEEGDISALFGGDISTDVEEQLIRRRKWDKVWFLRRIIMDRAMRTQKRYCSVFGRKLRLLQPERIIVTDIRARMPYKGSKRAAADFLHHRRWTDTGARHRK